VSGAGLLRGLEVALPARFGPEGERLFAAVRSIDDVGALEAVTERLKTARTPDEVRAALARAAGAGEPAD
jgi:hypothetical protein